MRWKLVFAFLLPLLACIALPVPAASSIAPTAPEIGVRPAVSADGLIVYTKLGDSDASTGGIFAINADGTDKRRLVRSHQASVGAVSPDGSSFAYNNRAGLYVREVDGGEPVRVYDASVGSISWSPDGLRIAFVEHIDARSNWEVVVLTLATGRTKIITDTAEHEQNVSWSPGGDRLAISSPGDRGCSFFEETYYWNEIMLVRPNGTPIANLTADLPAADWVVHDWGQAGLLVRAGSFGESGDPEDVCPNPPDSPSFVLSPSGDTRHEIATRLTDRVLALSPDGTSYLFARGESFLDYDLWLGDLRSTDIQRLVRQSGFGDWAPSTT